MTKIEWVKNADGSEGRSWNPVVGCSLASPGCANCYAMKMAARLEAMGQAHYAGLTQPSKAGAVWTGKIAIAPDSVLLAPLKRKKPTTYFVNSMGDLFHEGVTDEQIDRVFAVMALCPQHTFQVLTKRARRMRDYIASKRQLAPQWVAFPSLGERVLLPYEGCYPKNIWLGISAEDQKRADERIPHLLQTPASVRFVSCEPLLGEINLSKVRLWTAKPEYCSDQSLKDYDFVFFMDALRGVKNGTIPALDWVIVGGESGPGARPMHPQWARDIRDQCAVAGVPFFFKQYGQWGLADRGDPNTIWMAEDGWHHAANGMYDPPFDVHKAKSYALLGNIGKSRAGCLLDGREHKEMPR